MSKKKAKINIEGDKRAFEQTPFSQLGEIRGVDLVLGEGVKDRHRCESFEKGLPVPFLIKKFGKLSFIKEKKGRAGKIVTVLRGDFSVREEAEAFLKELKQELGCGGALKEGGIELQGDKIEGVKKFISQRKNSDKRE